MLALSIIVLGVLVTGALSSLLNYDIFWLIIAVWSFSVASFLSMTNAQGRMSVIGLPAMMAFPFILMIVDGPLNLDLSSGLVSITWAAEICSLFALCLATLMIINTRTSVRMNRSLIAGFTYLTFETVSALQGPIGYYNDLLLGTNHMPNNSDLMAYIIASTIGGILLLLVSVLLKKRSVRRGFKSKAVDP